MAHAKEPIWGGAHERAGTAAVTAAAELVETAATSARAGARGVGETASAEPDAPATATFLVALFFFVGAGGALVSTLGSFSTFSI